MGWGAQRGQLLTPVQDASRAQGNASMRLASHIRKHRQNMVWNFFETIVTYRKYPKRTQTTIVTCKSFPTVIKTPLTLLFKKLFLLFL